LPLDLLVAQPPSHVGGAVRVRLDPSFLTKLVLEARRTDKRQLAVGDAALVAVAFLGEGSVVAEKDDPEPSGLGVVAPIDNASLSRFIAERRLVLLHEEVTSVEPTERLGASDWDAGTDRAELCVLGNGSLSRSGWSRTRTRPSGWKAGTPPPEARYEQREAVELAFVAALQHLSASQRAVLLLRDVLGFSAKETAGTLETTVASVNSALQRARRRVNEQMPARSQQVTLRSLGDERIRAIVEGYLDAWERGDVAALAAMLAEDATFAMPPYPTWWRGREVIAAFAVVPLHRYLRTQANGQAANAAYRWDAQRGSYMAEALECSRSKRAAG
jgi:Sigma-70, region 4/SnoaL-like domain